MPVPGTPTAAPPAPPQMAAPPLMAPPLPHPAPVVQRVRSAARAAETDGGGWTHLSAHQLRLLQSVEIDTRTEFRGLVAAGKTKCRGDVWRIDMAAPAGKGWQSAETHYPTYDGGIDRRAYRRTITIKTTSRSVVRILHRSPANFNVLTCAFFVCCSGRKAS